VEATRQQSAGRCIFEIFTTKPLLVTYPTWTIPRIPQWLLSASSPGAQLESSLVGQGAKKNKKLKEKKTKVAQNSEVETVRWYLSPAPISPSNDMYPVLLYPHPIQTRDFNFKMIYFFSDPLISQFLNRLHLFRSKSFKKIKIYFPRPLIHTPTPTLTLPTHPPYYKVVHSLTSTFSLFSFFLHRKLPSHAIRVFVYWCVCSSYHLGPEGYYQP
jgi:hypothetical protein